MLFFPERGALKENIRSLERTEKRNSASSDLRVDDRCEARLRGGSRWEPGRIAYKNARDGSYDVEFDNGEIHAILTYAFVAVCGIHFIRG